jgi:hypothetical protein
MHLLGPRRTPSRFVQIAAILRAEAPIAVYNWAQRSQHTCRDSEWQPTGMLIALPLIGRRERHAKLGRSRPLLIFGTESEAAMIALLASQNVFFSFQAIGLDQLLTPAANIFDVLGLLLVAAITIACIVPDRLIHS